MRTRFPLLCLTLVTAGLLAGCGGSKHRASGPVRDRVLVKNELAGFRPVSLKQYTTLAKWLEDGLPGQVSAEGAMLRRAGFRGGAQEHLVSNGTQGLSLVLELSSPGGARVAARYYLARVEAPDFQGGAYAPFTVSGIPGATGYSLGGGAIDIAFTDGSYYYLVGQVGDDPSTIVRLNAAARSLYARVHA